MSEFGEQFERLELFPASGGRFEVRINDELVFDKKQAGRFPEVEEIKAQIQKRL